MWPESRGKLGKLGEHVRFASVYDGTYIYVAGIPSNVVDRIAFLSLLLPWGVTENRH